jgi:hypothetical protein
MIKKQDIKTQKIKILEIRIARLENDLARLSANYYQSPFIEYAPIFYKQLCQCQDCK